MLVRSLSVKSRKGYVFDTFASRAGLVHDVTEYWEQNGSNQRRFIANRTRNRTKKMLCDFNI